MKETQVQSLGREDPMEKGMATHASILAWRSPWTEEPGGLQYLGLQRCGNQLLKLVFPTSPIPLVKILISLMMSQEFGGVFFNKSLRPEFISIFKCSRHFKRAQRCSGLIKGHTEVVSVGSSIAKGSI